MLVGTNSFTTLDQECGTKSNGVSMFTVQCRVIVDNKCDANNNNVNQK